jgi:hypothetical protein
MVIPASENPTPARRPEKTRDRALLTALAIPWLATLVFYWWTDADVAPNGHMLAGLLISYLLFWGLIFWWSDLSRRRKVRVFLLSSGSIAFTVGLFELGVLVRAIDFRLVLGSVPLVNPLAHPGNQLDPTLLHIERPHNRFIWQGVEYLYDQHGLRNESDLRDADIIVVGDSFVEGMAVSAGELLTSRMSERLGRTVANVGQSYYGPQQELELLRRIGLGFHPKTCVWVFFEGNDLDDIFRYKKTREDWERLSQQLHSFAERSFTKNSLLAARRLLDKLRRNIGQVPPSTDRGKDLSGVFVQASGERTRLTFWYRGHRLSGADLRSLEELRTILGQANELCRTHGIRFLVVFAPTKFRVYHSVTEFEADAQPGYWVINDLPERVRAILRDHVNGSEYLDLTSPLTDAAERGLLVYQTWDSHWTGEGHRIAADAIAAVLRAGSVGTRGHSSGIP